MNFDEAAILVGVDLAHQPAFLGALDQPYYRIVAALQEFGELRDRGPAPARVGRHTQQKLVLLRGDSGSSCHSFAESKKTPEPIAKPSQLPQGLGPHWRYGCGVYGPLHHPNHITM